MKIIEINYDLNKSGQNYEGLINKIKTIANGYARPCKSFWLIRTNMTQQEVYNSLLPFIDQNDTLLVSLFDIYGCYGWIASGEVLNWINSQKKQNLDLEL